MSAELHRDGMSAGGGRQQPERVVGRWNSQVNPFRSCQERSISEPMARKTAIHGTPSPPEMTSASIP